jgi:hypothetical protein
LECRFRRGEIDDDLASIKERRKIVGDRNPCVTAARSLPSVVAQRAMAFPFDCTGQRQDGRIFNQRNHPTAHATSGPCNDDVDHPNPYASR